MCEKKCKVSINHVSVGRGVEKQREKRFPCGIIKGIYFLINSYKALAFGIVGIRVLEG